MNEIKIFKDEMFKDIGQKEQLQYLGSLSLILASAIDSEDEESAWECLREASILGHPYESHAFNMLYMATAMEVTRHYANFEKKTNGFIDNIKRFLEDLKNG